MRRLFIAALLLLPGCSATSQAVIDAALSEGEAGIKAAKDREALAIKSAVCLMGLGAAGRTLTPAEYEAALVFCPPPGGGEDRSLSLQDLQAIGRAMDLLRTAEEN